MTQSPNPLNIDEKKPISISDEAKLNFAESDLPFSPPGVDYRKILSNGKLISDEQTVELKKANLAAGKKYKKSIKDKKGEVNTDYSIIVTNQKGSSEKSYFAVYEGYIGKGGYGKVRWLQDLDTKKWYVLKAQKAESRIEKGTAEHEVKALDIQGKIHSSFEREKKPKDGSPSYNQHFMIMEAAPGVSLNKIIRSKLSALQWLYLFKQAIEELNELHKKGILHCDIKPANLMFDILTKTFNYVDFGIWKKPGREFSPVGTPAYMASEVLEKYKIPDSVDLKDTKVIYNSKNDIYSLGKTFAEVFGLAKWVETPEEDLKKLDANKQEPLLKQLQLLDIANKDDNKSFLENKTFPDVETRTQVLNLLTQMTNDLSKNRPTLEAASKTISNLISKLEVNQKNKVGFLDVDEYIKLKKQTMFDDDNEALNNFHSLFKKFDEIVLFDSSGKFLDSEILTIRKEIESNNVKVNPKLIKNLPNQQLNFASLSSEFAKQYPDNSYFYIKPSANNQEFNKLLENKVYTLTPNSNIDSEIQMHLDGKSKPFPEEKPKIEIQEDKKELIEAEQKSVMEEPPKTRVSSLQELQQGDIVIVIGIDSPYENVATINKTTKTAQSLVSKPVGLNEATHVAIAYGNDRLIHLTKSVKTVTKDAFYSEHPGCSYIVYRPKDLTVAKAITDIIFRDIKLDEKQVEKYQHKDDPKWKFGAGVKAFFTSSTNRNKDKMSSSSICSKFAIQLVRKAMLSIGKNPDNYAGITFNSLPKSLDDYLNRNDNYYVLVKPIDDKLPLYNKLMNKIKECLFYYNQLAIKGDKSAAIKHELLLENFHSALRKIDSNDNDVSKVISLMAEVYPSLSYSRGIMQSTKYKEVLTLLNQNGIHENDYKNLAKELKAAKPKPSN